MEAIPVRVETQCDRRAVGLMKRRLLYVKVARRPVLRKA